MKRFMKESRARGWHPVLYGDGLYWITKQPNAGYDGTEYFRARGGETMVIAKWDGTPWENVADWRSHYVTCVGTEAGRDVVLGMTRGMAALGADVIQQFDQNTGPMACYSDKHGHPPVPGPWMTEGFTKLLKADLAAAKAIDPAAITSSEGPAPEIHLQTVQTWDARIKLCPLFSYIYHEYVNGFATLYLNRVNDEGMRASAARALVNGYSIGFSLRDKGQIAFDFNQPWDRAVPDQRSILEWARRTTHFRAEVARDFLVFGRMIQPWRITNVREHDLGWGREPVVQSGTWRAQDGRTAVVLANYADLRQTPRIELPGEGARKIRIVLDDKAEVREVRLPYTLELEMQPRALAMVALE